MLGYSLEELLEQSAEMLYIDLEEFKLVGKEKYSQIRKQGTGTVETRWKRKDGTILDVLLSSAPIDPSDLSAGVTFTALDLTERKQAEADLQDSEERFRTALEANPDPFILYDMDGQVLFFNPAFTRVFGWTLEEQLGKKMDQFVPEKNWPETRTMIETVLAGKSVSATETCRYTKDGQIIPVIISGAIYHDRQSNPIGSIINLRDISEQKRLQSQLQQAQRMEAIGTLAGGIAHDFNNILSAVIGYTEIALNDVEKDSLLQSNLKEVLNAGARAKDLVKQILTFSRQAEQELKPVQIKIAVNEALKLIRASLPTTIEIHQTVESNSAVLADLTQMHQVVMNLCTNASHAMQAAGGTLRVSLVDVEIESDFAAGHPGLLPGPYIQLSVMDTGHGMTSEVLNRIYDPFFTTKEKGEGTGMGLSVVHGIVKSHGGEVIVHSEPGKGTSFEIYFPAIEKTEIRKTDAVLPLAIGNERILFVDDEPSLVHIGKQILEPLGYKVEARTSSLEALELFKVKSEKFDLVITDMTMPKMTGDDLAREILKIRTNIPIILCTGYSKKISEGKAEALGVRALVMKPIVAEQLAKIVRQVLDEG
jgi:PAS domain S-box-containing protein